jgi:hypothetical protein
MGTLSNQATSDLVDHVFKSAYTPISTLYLALCTAAPTAASTGATITETDYTNYVRKSITVADFDAAAARKIIQTEDIDFVQAGGVSTSDISHWAICDASSAGDMLAFGAFNSSWNVVNGNTPTIADTEIEISIGASGGAGFTNVAVHLMLNLMFRNIAWATPSATIHFGLATGTIADDDAIGDVTECSGGSYAREPVPAASMDAASAGVTANGLAAITFDTPTGSWGLVTTMFVVDDLSGTSGDLLAYDNTNIVDQTPTTDDTIQFAIDAFDVDLD